MILADLVAGPGGAGSAVGWTGRGRSEGGCRGPPRRRAGGAPLGRRRGDRRAPGARSCGQLCAVARGSGPGRRAAVADGFFGRQSPELALEIAERRLSISATAALVVQNSFLSVFDPRAWRQHLENAALIAWQVQGYAGHGPARPGRSGRGRAPLHFEFDVVAGRRWLVASRDPHVARSRGAAPLEPEAQRLGGGLGVQGHRQQDPAVTVRSRRQVGVHPVDHAPQTRRRLWALARPRAAEGPGSAPPAGRRPCRCRPSSIRGSTQRMRPASASVPAKLLASPASRPSSRGSSARAALAGAFIASGVPARRCRTRSARPDREDCPQPVPGAVHKPGGATTRP